jgi:ABC-2 type transport system permease protein
MKALSLATRNLKEIFRDPVSIFLGLALPIGFLLLFTSIEKRLPLELFSAQMLAPAIVIFSFSFLIMFSGTLLAKDRQSAFLVRLFATPLKSSDYILAYMLPFIPLAFCQMAVCLLAGVIMGATFHGIIPIILILTLTALICIALGTTLGAIFTIGQVSGIGSVLITTISIFSGAWMDLNMVGGAFKSIAYAMPFAHAIDAVRWLAKGNSVSGVWYNIYWLFGYAVVLIPLCIWIFSRKTKQG